MTDEQLHAVWAACSEMAGEPDAPQACRRLSRRLTEIIGAPTVIYRRTVSPWRLITSVPGAPADGAPAIPGAEELDRLGTAPASLHPIFTGGGQYAWTPIALDDGAPSQSLVLLPGDWRQDAAWLPRFARTASLALRLAATAQVARRNQALTAETYSLAQRLSRITNGALLYQLIVDSAARFANARLGGLSLFEPTKGSIIVTATHGYPAEAAEHMRIVPGSGIIGGVFSSRKPLLVRDTGRVPGLAPRSRRYQTASFMAVPIVAGDEALGVVTLADRADGHPFSRADLTATRHVSALAALALSRQELSRRTDELAHAAAIDPLTTLFNRRYLQTRLEVEIERTRRTGQPVAVLMVDVDSFKPINDRLGHQTGDTVLRTVADIIRRSVRASDVSTRYGGDEFAVIVAENAPGAAQTAERIRRRVEAFRWESLGFQEPLHVTVSVGVAIGALGESPEMLIGRADQHMYKAKAEGRNRVSPENR